MFAGFWRRFIAYMIDGFIISAIFTILAIIAGGAYFAGAISGGGAHALIAQLENPERMTEFTGWIWLFSIAINIAYFTYFHGATGRTPGKKILSLQVVSTNGTAISFGTAFLRSAGYLLSSAVFCLGYIWIGFDKKKQGWHDKIAGTVVVIREPLENTSGITIPDSAGAPRTGVMDVEAENSQKIP